MIRGIYLVLLLCLSLQAEVLKPLEQIEVKGIVEDIMIDGDILTISTDVGIVQVYDLAKKKFVKEIKIPQIKDFVGDSIEANIFSVDRRGERYLFLSDSGKGGYSNLWLVEGETREKIISSKDKKSLIKARFIDDSHILLGYLGNEAALFDIKAKKERYRVQLNPSRFSDFALNEDKTHAVYACESGILNMIDTHTGKTIKVLEGINRDNVIQVDYKKGIVSGAGKDKRGSLYDVLLEKNDFIQGDFFIYATALSPSSRQVAFAMDENNDVTIFERETKKILWKLTGATRTIHKILFKDEHTIIATSNSPMILLWNTTKKEKR